MHDGQLLRPDIGAAPATQVESGDPAARIALDPNCLDWVHIATAGQTLVKVLLVYAHLGGELFALLRGQVHA